MATILTEIFKTLIELTLVIGLLGQAAAMEAPIGMIPRPQVESSVQAGYGAEGPTLEKGWRLGETRQLIIDRANYYGINVELSLFIGKKESGYDEFAVNPKSGAVGPFQWLKSSWEVLCEGNRLNRFDNVECFMQTMTDPKGISHWTADPRMFQWLYEAGFINEQGELKYQYRYK